MCCFNKVNLSAILLVHKHIIIKLCLNERYGRVQVGIFPIKNGLKQGDVLSPLLSNFVLECAIRRVQENQDGLKLNGIHHIVVYNDGVNIPGGTVHSTFVSYVLLIVLSCLVCNCC